MLKDKPDLYNNIQYNDTQHNGIQHNGIQHNGIQHNGIQHNGIQHNGIQHNGIQQNDRVLLCLLSFMPNFENIPFALSVVMLNVIMPSAMAPQSV
jgi:hypothetical protein